MTLPHEFQPAVDYARTILDFNPEIKDGLLEWPAKSPMDLYIVLSQIELHSKKNSLPIANPHKVYIESVAEKALEDKLVEAESSVSMGDYNRAARALNWVNNFSTKYDMDSKNMQDLWGSVYDIAMDDWNNGPNTSVEKPRRLDRNQTQALKKQLDHLIQYGQVAGREVPPELFDVQDNLNDRLRDIYHKDMVKTEGAMALIMGLLIVATPFLYLEKQVRKLFSREDTK